MIRASVDSGITPIVRVGVGTYKGHLDLATAAGPTGGPQLNLYRFGTFHGGTMILDDSFFAYDPAFPGGVFVG